MDTLMYGCTRMHVHKDVFHGCMHGRIQGCEANAERALHHMALAAEAGHTRLDHCVICTRCAICVPCALCTAYFGIRSQRCLHLSAVCM
jgi:hypothetical protein